MHRGIFKNIGSLRFNRKSISTAMYISFYHPYIERKLSFQFIMLRFLFSVSQYLIIIRRRKSLLTRSFRSKFHRLSSDPNIRILEKIPSNNHSFESKINFIIEHQRKFFLRYPLLSTFAFTFLYESALTIKKIHR